MAYNPFRDGAQQSTQSGRVNPFRQTGTGKTKSDRERVARNWQSDAEQHGILNNPQYTDEGKEYQRMAQEYARYGTQYQNQLKQGVTGRQWQQNVNSKIEDLQSRDWREAYKGNAAAEKRVSELEKKLKQLNESSGWATTVDQYDELERQKREINDELKTYGYDKQIAELRKEKEWADYFADAGLRDEEGYQKGAQDGRVAYESQTSTRKRIAELEDRLVLLNLTSGAATTTGLSDDIDRERSEINKELKSLGAGYNVYQLADYTMYERNDISDKWSDEEKSNFYYLYNGSREEAEAYARRVNDRYAYNAAQKKKDDIGKWASQNAATAVLGSIASVGLTATSLADTLDRGKEYAASGDIAQKELLTPADIGMTMTSAIGSALNEKHGTLDDSVWLLGGKGLGDLYELGMSVVNSMASVYALGGLGTYANFFGQASKSAYEEAIARGLSVDKALTYSYASGAAEVAGEIFSIEHLIKMKNPSSLKGIIKNIFVQGGIEASEESATTLMNTISDAMINGDKSELASNYYALIQAGYEPGEAQRLAISDWTQGILYDALGGFASGFTSGAMQSGIQGGRRYAGDAQQLMDYAKSEGADTAAAKRAAKYEKRMAKGKGLTNYQAGTLSELTNQTVASKDIESIRNAAGKRLEALGETNAAVADAVAAQAVQKEAKARGVTVPQVTNEQEKRPNVTLDSTDGKVVGFKDGKVRVEVTENGKKTLREAAIDEVEGLPEQTRKLFTAISGYDGATQATMYAAYMPGQNIERYVQAADIAMNLYGALSNATLEQARSVGRASLRVLNDTQLETLMQAGRKEAANKKAAADEQRTADRESGKKSGKGKVSYGGGEVGGQKLKAASKKAVDRMSKSEKALANAITATGVNIVFYESEADSSGKYHGAQGIYRNSTVYIDVNAGLSSKTGGQRTIVLTAAHELTHFIREFNEAGYTDLREYVTEKLLEQGSDIEELITRKMARETREMSYDDAMEEVIADACEMMLTDPSALSELASDHSSLAQKMRKWLTDFIAKLKKAFTGLEAAHDEAKAMTDYMDELRTMWGSALSDAARGMANKNAAENGDGAARYSLREFSDGTKFVDVQTDQKIFDGLAADEMPAQARELIKSKFAGKVIGVTNRAYVNGASANEYAHPVKNITDKKIKEAKMRASAELDNLIEAGQNFRTRPDGAYGHKHIRAVGGFSYFDVIFKVGNEYFKGTINIENNAKGARFKDVTKIEDVTKDIVSSIGQNPKSKFLSDISMDSIRSSSENSNTKSEKNSAREIAAERGKRRAEIYSELQRLRNERNNILEQDAGYAAAQEKRRKAQTFKERVEATRAINAAKAKIDTAELDERIQSLQDEQTAINDEERAEYNAEKEKYSGTKTRGYAELPDTRTAELDSEYNDAVKRGDKKTMQALVLEAVERAMPSSVIRDADGKLLPVYHWTNASFNSFDRSYARTGNEMDGFFFAPDARSTREYGDNAVRAYLNITNPAYDPYLDRTHEDSGTLLREKLAYEGYDGVIRTENGKIVEYMAFDPEQIKSADAVVYDDSGKVIPLSERFNAKKNDIRYSTREIDGQPIAWIENSGLSSKDLRNYKKVAEYIGQHIGEVYTIIESGQRVYIGDDLPREYTQSEYTKRLLKNQSDTLRAKNKAASVLGDMIEIASGRRWERTKHTHNKDAKYGMYRYNSRFAFATKDAAGGVNVHAYDVELLIRNASDGKKYLYDIVNIKKNTAYAIELQQRESRSGGIKAASRNGVSEDSIRAKSANVNTEDKYSMRDVTENDTKQELAERKKSYAQLRRENAALKARVEQLKGQTRLTRKVNGERIARSLAKAYYSQASISEVASRIQELGNYLVQNDGDALSYDELRSRANGIAENLIENAAMTSLDDAELATYTDYLKDTPMEITDGTAGDFSNGAYSEISRKIKLKENGRSVSEAWAELQEMFGEDEFPNGIEAQSDMLRIMDSKLTEWAAVEGNPFATHMGEAINSAANDILTEVLGAGLRGTEATYADKAEAKRRADVAAERARGEERLQGAIADEQVRIASRDERIERLQGIIEDERAKRREAVAKERAEKWAKHDAVKQYYQDLIKRQRADREENAGKAKYRARVEKRTKELSDWLLTNSDKKHIPEVLKKTIGDFLGTLDFTSVGALNGKADTQKAARFRQRLNELQNALLRQADALNENADVDTFTGYLDIDSDTMDALSELVQDVDSAIAESTEWTVNRMSAADLEKLDQVLKVLQHSVKNMNRLLANAHFKTAIEAAQSTMQRTDPLRQNTEKAAAVKRFLAWDNITPVYAFRRFGEGGKTVFESLTRGWDKMAFNMEAIVNFAEGAYKAEEIKAWEKDIRETTLTSGEKVQMPVSAMMELYVTAKQEQAMSHLNGAGMKVRSFADGRTTISQAEPFLMTADDVAHIGEQLTDRQRAVADALQRFAAETGAEWGNEVSMKRYGYRAFTEENYWPIATDSNSRNAVDEKARENDMFRLLNMSMTKGRNKKANNALVVGSIFDTFASHMADMAKYNALALPILDMMKWYNYREKVKLPTGQEKVSSVQQSIEGAYGTAAKNYITTLLKDINGTQEMGRGEGLPRKLISNYKVAAVAANLRVALLQPTSYVRAAMELDARYLAKGALMKGGMEEMLKYSGTAVWKDFGGYDTNISRNIRDQIKHDASLGDTIKEKSMMGAELGDKLTWGALWNACKLEVQDKQHLKGDALMQATADRFREVIYLTQVMDSTLTRSHNMRSKSTYASLATAFMSEPTLSYSMVEDAFADYLDERKLTNGKAAWQKVQGKFMKALSIYAASAAASAIVESIADAWRDDDDYQSFVEKILEAMFGTKDGWFLDGNLIGDLSVTAKLPLVKDIWSMLGGYSSDRMDLASIQNLIKAGQIWWETIGLATGRLEKPTDVTYNGKMTWYGKLYNTFKPLSQLTGYAGSNIMRETAAIWSNTIGAWTGKKLQTYYPGVKTSVKYGYQDGYLSAEEAKNILINEGAAEDENEVYFLLEEWDSGKSSYSRYNAVKDAVKAGDKAAYKDALNALTTHGVTERNARSAVRSALKEWYQGTEDAPQSMSKQDTIKRLQDFCGMTKADAEATVLEWTCKLVTGTEYGDIKSAYLDGSINDVKAKQMLMRYGGLTSEEADKRVLNYKFEEQYGFTYSRSNVQTEFIRGSISESTAKQMLTQYGGKTAEEAERSVQAFKFLRSYPEYDAEDITEAQIAKYYESVQSSGVSVRDYVNYTSFVRSTSADVDANGNAISGSKMQKIMEYIDKLNLTAQQKDVLFLTQYAASNLKKTPWH